MSKTNSILVSFLVAQTIKINNKSCLQLCFLQHLFNINCLTILAGFWEALGAPKMQKIEQHRFWSMFGARWVFHGRFGRVWRGFWKGLGRFWVSFRRYFGALFHNLEILFPNKHFQICCCFGKQSCLNLVAVVSWSRSRRILASIWSVTWLQKRWNLLVFWEKQWTEVANIIRI